MAFNVKRIRAALRTVATGVALAPVYAYRRLVSPLLPARCKYHPSCSRYAIDAVREVGILRGSVLAAWRLARCNPWSNGGYDPIEARPFFRPDADPQRSRDEHDHERHGVPA
jgi:uncharacterized protein